jgi:hypothetical protein
MSDSDSWRDLAAQFLALARPQGDIHARWQYTVGSGVVGNWTLGGDCTLQIQFEALARRAAVGLPNKHSYDLLIAWLEAIREDRRGFEMLNSFPTEINDDGSRGATYCLGSIRGVCEASVNFCRVLESLALQAEFEGKKRNDPHNYKSHVESTPHHDSTPAEKEEPRKRLSVMIYCPSAARKMENYLEANGIGLTQFATSIGTTDRTLRSFRKTGKVKRSIFDDIAGGMGTTKESLLKG